MIMKKNKKTIEANKSDMKEKALNQLMTQFMQYQWNTFKSEAYPFEILAHNKVESQSDLLPSLNEGEAPDFFPTLP